MDATTLATNEIIIFVFLIPLALSVVTAFITSLLTTLINKKWIREEIAENEIIVKYWDDLKLFSKELHLYKDDIRNMYGEISLQIEKKKQIGNPNQKYQKETTIFQKYRKPCLIRIVKLREMATISFPIDVIIKINELDKCTYNYFGAANIDLQDLWSDFISIIDSISEVENELRRVYSNMISHKLKLSKGLSEINIDLFNPIDIQHAKLDIKNNK